MTVPLVKWKLERLDAASRVGAKTQTGCGIWKTAEFSVQCGSTWRRGTSQHTCRLPQQSGIKCCCFFFHRSPNFIALHKAPVAIDLLGSLRESMLLVSRWTNHGVLYVVAQTLQATKANSVMFLLQLQISAHCISIEFRNQATERNKKPGTLEIEPPHNLCARLEIPWTHRETREPQLLWQFLRGNLRARCAQVEVQVPHQEWRRQHNSAAARDFLGSQE